MKKGDNFYSTSASCCLVRPPFRRSSNRLPTTGQLVGPGIASRLCALDAAWGQRAASTASFSPRTHTEEVGLKCCSPKDFFFSTSTIWGTFWICALIVKTNASRMCSFRRRTLWMLFFFFSLKQLPPFLCYLSEFLGSVTSSRQYIYPESVHSCPAPNQSGTGPAWCGRRAHHSFMDPRWEDRMTPETPRKCP